MNPIAMPSIVSQCNLSLTLHGQPAGSVAARYGRTRRSMVYAGQHSVKKRLSGEFHQKHRCSRVAPTSRNHRTEEELEP